MTQCAQPFNEEDRAITKKKITASWCPGFVLNAEHFPVNNFTLSISPTPIFPFILTRPPQPHHPQLLGLMILDSSVSIANRRLETNIERVLEKVEHGVQIFENAWEYVHAVSSSSQKDNYDCDVKTGMKNLHLLREHIKSSQGDSSIEDKEDLDYYRKQLESKMERFKGSHEYTTTTGFTNSDLLRISRTTRKTRLEV